MARSKLTEEKRLAILADSGTLREVAAGHGVSHQTVANVCKQETSRLLDELREKTERTREAFFKLHAEYQTDD